MRAALLVFFASMFFLFSSSVYCFAGEESFGFNDLNFKAGVKGWYNTADIEIKYQGTKSSVSESAFMAGGSFFASYQRFFGGINFLTTADDYDGTDRDDIDLIFGYMLNDKIGLMCGYKNMTLTEDSEDVVKLNTLVIGASYNHPTEVLKLNDPLIFSANISFMPFMAVELFDVEADEAYGYSLDLSASYPLNNFILNAGYKYEFHTSDFDDGLEYEENFHGPYFSAFYSF